MDTSCAQSPAPAVITQALSSFPVGGAANCTPERISARYSVSFCGISFHSVKKEQSQRIP